MQGFGRQPADFDGAAVIYNAGLWHGTDDWSFYKIIFDKVCAYGYSGAFHSALVRK